MNDTVQSAWLESVLRATDIVILAEEPMSTRLNTKATPRKYSKGLPPTYSAQSTRFVTIG